MKTAKHAVRSLTAERNLAAVRRALLRWYDKNRRDLPWRGTRDPYCIWLSEIMLQQTRVAAVLEPYRVFLERFPNVQALAEASEGSVLAAWSGLGYYRRARMLHQCAKTIVTRRGGRFPEACEGLRELPGIGRYTAAAIASIAFREPEAVVDGNVERVLERLTGRVLPAAQTWERAQALLCKSRPGDFNQAMMELGATVCLPRQPNCPDCPLRRWCATRGEIQRTRRKSRQLKLEIWCALEERDGHIRLIRRSADESVMAGMWELPHWPELPPSHANSSRWKTFRHSITVTDYAVHVVRGAGARGRGRWIARERIPEVPITGLTRKILRADGII